MAIQVSSLEQINRVDYLLFQTGAWERKKEWRLRSKNIE